MNKKGTIMVVDDTATLMLLLTSIIEDAGFETIVAENGELALAALENVEPDLILLDILMPGIDGFEVCRRIKLQDRLKNIPIIFLSALTDRKDRVKGLKLGAVDFILKPFEAEELLAKVYNHTAIRILNTELIQYKEQLETMVQIRTEELENTNATKDKLLSIIAHDLKNPFAAVLSSTDLLFEYLEIGDLVKAKAKVQTIQNATRHGYALLQNLLEWSCSQKGILSFNLICIDISNIIQNCLDLHYLAAQNKNIQLINNVNSTILVKVDTNHITTILRNLISNAIKFTNEKGKVEINAIINDTALEISIIDNGIGMSKNTLSKLFRIDEKICTPGTANEKGTGLGLILCHEFIEKHGGTIRAESELGKGSIIKFTIPLCNE